MFKRLLRPGATGVIISEVAPIDGEDVVFKRLPNSFAGTDLHDRLQASLAALADRFAAVSTTAQLLHA